MNQSSSIKVFGSVSKVLISQYQAEVARIIGSGGTPQESSIRITFQKLLHEYCKTKDFQLITKLDYQTRFGNIVYPDGTVKDALRLDWGYWNREDGNLDWEIANKLSQGYPDSNILFEDSQTAVLIQAGTEVMRVSMQDGEALERILNRFFNYIPPEVSDFRTAIEIFKQDLPTIIDALRDILEQQSASNPEFQRAKNQIWEICKESINPEVTLLDIREMLIQHILMEDILIDIFNDSQYHQENNIARELQQAIDTFFTASTKSNLLRTIERYYGVIRKAATNIYNHHEKQKFLKAVYENFYRAYNPQTAKRLGIFYTPNEVVHFIIESVDYLLEQYFQKKLASKNIEILDPATGTGTFITELIEYLPKNKLKYKYKNEIHCNEVAILPYYIASLNIEFTYKQKMGKYEEFDNICFVDTLEHAFFEGKQGNLFGLNVENNERIQRQNDRTISVIIGNPPYHAERHISYPALDRRVKETYVKNSKARKTKAYDLYARFLRWASDRLGKNGIIAFVSNNSFIDARTYDGLRKVVTSEFNEVYIINLKGNARTSGDRRHQEGGNVFNNAIRVGIAIYFLVRNERDRGCKIYYHALPDCATTEEKNTYLAERKFSEIQFDNIVPDRDNNWLGRADNDFSTLIPLADRETKFSKNRIEERAIFQLFTLGVITARDEWVYAESETALAPKVRYLINIYNQAVENRGVRNSSSERAIKWTRRLKKYLNRGITYQFRTSNIRDCLYRPFVTKKLYFSPELNEMQYQLGQVFDSDRQNLLIGFTAPGSTKSFMTLASDRIPDYHFIGDSQCLPLYRYNENGDRLDNITDWGLEQFQTRYSSSAITKLDIFHYTYAILHYPAYRTKYQLNLTKEFPRLPFYDNFQQWVNWGQKLIELHINYETVELYPLRRIDASGSNVNKVKLKANKDTGIIIIDTITTLEGIPSIAWEYMLGNYSALEWVLDRYKEKKPKDKTIAARFHTYRFADYKETAIALLQRVCTVSVATMRIVQEMRDS